MTLPYDYSRCMGYFSTTATPWGASYTGRAACLHCQRRVSPGHPERQSYFAELPIFVDGKCPERKAPGWEVTND